MSQDTVNASPEELADGYKGQANQLRQMQKALKDIRIEEPLTPRKVAALGPEAIEESIRQEQLILSGRIGSVVVNEMPKSRSAFQEASCICLCGESMLIRLSDLRKSLKGEGERPAYFPPFDSPEEKIIRPCRHLSKLARKRHPALYSRWTEMRKTVQNCAANGEEYKVKKEWFHRETGFLSFLSDILPGMEEGKALKRHGKVGDHLPENYYWELRPTTVKGAPEEVRKRRLLANRFYAAKADARKRGVPFEWDLTSFVATFHEALEREFPSVPLENIRIQWLNHQEKGYLKDNWRLTQVSHARKSRSKKFSCRFVGHACTQDQFALAVARVTTLLLDDQPGSIASAIEQVKEEMGWY
jgi:hypothetical protein